eukprot:g41566.t1
MSKPRASSPASVRSATQQTGKKERTAKSHSRRSTSPRSDTPPPCKKRKRSRGGLDSTSDGHAWLLELPVDLWCYIRDCIGWTKLAALARVCRRLARLVKDPQFWKGFEEPVLDLSKFRNGSPLVALGEHLSLLDCRGITDAGLARLSALPLHYLDLSDCDQITDDGLAYLSELPLQNLNLRFCLIDAGLAHLSALPLQHLNISECDEITDAGLAHLSTLPLRHLDLIGCDGLTESGLAHLSMLSLQHLDLSGCKNITDAGLAHFLSSTSFSKRAAESLTLGWLTYAGLAYLSALPLQHLNLTGCLRVTDAGLAHLSALPIRHLKLTNCVHITDSGLAHLSPLPLQRLAAAFCRGITEAGRHECLGKALPKSSVMSPDAAATAPTKSWFSSITPCSSVPERVGFQPQVGGSQFSALGVDLRGQLLQAPDCAGHYLQDLRGGVAGLSDLRAMDRRLQQQQIRLLADLLARAARSQLSLQLVEVCLLVLPQQRWDGLNYDGSWLRTTHRPRAKPA